MPALAAGIFFHAPVAGRGYSPGTGEVGALAAIRGGGSIAQAPEDDVQHRMRNLPTVLAASTNVGGNVGKAGVFSPEIATCWNCLGKVV